MENTSKIAFLSVISNSLVVMLKIVVGIITGSVAILCHSFFFRFDRRLHRLYLRQDFKKAG